LISLPGGGGTRGCIERLEEMFPSGRRKRVETNPEIQRNDENTNKKGGNIERVVTRFAKNEVRRMAAGKIDAKLYARKGPHVTERNRRSTQKEAGR